MSRHSQFRRWAKCQNKTTYKSKKEAQRNKDRIFHTEKRKLAVYKCKMCKKFHLTSTDKWGNLIESLKTK